MTWMAPIERCRAAVVLVAVALLLGCGASMQQRVTLAERPWLEVGTPHFVISTDLPRERAVPLARSLESMRAALLACAWPGASEPSGRTNVVIFRRLVDFGRYSGMGPQVAGVAVSRAGFERTIGFSPGSDDGLPRVAVHELAHDLSQWFLPVQPPWLAEGLAQYLEGVQLDPVKKKHEQRYAVMGTVSEESVSWLQRSRFTLDSERLFEMHTQHAGEPRQVRSFYAGSWFLVNYLLNMQGKPFVEFQERLSRMTPWRQAWQESFPGLSTEQLDSDMTDYARQGRLRWVKYAVQVPVYKPEVRALSTAEAGGVLALFSSLLAPDLSERRAEAALVLDPDELNALTVRFHSLSPAAVEARRAIAERAVAAHPEAGAAWLLAALTERGASRRAALQKAQRYAPDHPGVARLVAEDALRSGRPRLALDRIRLAMRRSAPSPDMLAIHVAALGASGRCADAAAFASSASALFATDCQVHDREQNREVPCGDIVRAAYDSVQSRCSVAAR
jgi:hypothetical protein